MLKEMYFVLKPYSLCKAWEPFQHFGTNKRIKKRTYLTEKRDATSALMVFSNGHKKDLTRWTSPWHAVMLTRGSSLPQSSRNCFSSSNCKNWTVKCWLYKWISPTTPAQLLQLHQFLHFWTTPLLNYKTWELQTVCWCIFRSWRFIHPQSIW